jgi:hypothetical protein
MLSRFSSKTSYSIHKMKTYMRNLLGYLTLVQCADSLALIMSHALVGDWEPSQIIVRNGSGRLLNQLVGE